MNYETAIMDRLKKHSSRGGKKLNGKQCLECRLVGPGNYSHIGVSNKKFADQFGLRNRAQHAAHRIAWSLYHGKPVPKKMKVLHRCDNPKCIEPDHLFIGTQADNVADMVSKGRQATLKGERNGQARLTESEVREIHASMARSPVIAAYYGISVPLIERIKGGKSWKHLKLGKAPSREHLKANIGAEHWRNRNV
jgi:hypothetical protein